MTSDLRQLYADHSGFVSDKWEAYFPVYERWLALYRQQPIRLLEVGVQNGGSLAVWGQYFSFAEKIFCRARIIAVVTFAREDENGFASLGELLRAPGDALADAADDFGFRLAAGPRGEFPFAHLRDADDGR